MDKELRNSLRAVVVACRQVLEEDVRRQLEGTYGVTPRGEFLAREEVAPYALDPREWAREREEILAAISHIESNGVDRTRAVERFVRETAFTVLNRLAALKLMEHPRRALIPESVGRAKESKGFLLFQKVSAEACRAARNGQVLDGGYRLYLESIFDDLADELGLLFDRRLPQSIVYPSDACMQRVLELLNQPGIAMAWAEDETIGWMYQYFTPKELRDEARKASPAPRNSHELAFRNQFYTPRYVVELLVDNTLGRIWHEMRGGATGITLLCRRLVRGTGQAFLAPETSEHQPASATDGLLEQPAWLGHRHRKDPRDLKVLDPACGSGHFLLYAFGVLEAIYQEAWEDSDAPLFSENGRRLRDDFLDIDTLRRAIPELILRHNLYGIDIDLRATQIAALALWLRAQRSYQEQRLRVPERPRITRCNVVCAEPMPGERELLEDFIGALEPKLLGQLLRVVFNSMALAGEAGSLLRIEDEIRGAIAEAKKQWLVGPKPEQLLLFPRAEQPLKQLQLFDVAGITDERFWHEAEARVIEALASYAGKATNGKGYLRRLFADDAAQGFAFIDICRQRFDVVLMNPPFGDASPSSVDALDKQLSQGGRELGAAFVMEAGARWAPEGYVGALLSTASWFKPTFSSWRRTNLLGERRVLRLGAHLGGDVLDEATVSASAIVTGPVEEDLAPILFFRLIRSKRKAEELDDAIIALNEGRSTSTTFAVRRENLLRLDTFPLAYWISNALRECLASLPRFEGTAGTVKQGTATADEFRFCRAWWEVDPKATGSKWMPFTKSSEYSPFWDDPTWVLNFQNQGDEIRATGKARLQGTDYFGRPGVTFPRKAVLGFNPRLHPLGAGFSDGGPVAFGKESISTGAVLAYLASRPVEYVLSLFVGSLQGEAGFHPNHYEVGLVARLPWPSFSPETLDDLTASGAKATRVAMSLFEADEVSHHFVFPAASRSASLTDASIVARQREVESVNEMLKVRNSLDPVVGGALGFSPKDLEEIESEFETRIPPSTGKWRPYFGAEADLPDARGAATALLSYAVGVACGRWDVRMALEPDLASQVSDAFDALPVCPPGMLVGPDGLPAQPGTIVSPRWLRARPNVRELPPPGTVLEPTIADGEYPVRVAWDGILVDDPGHADDVVRHVRDVLEVVFKDRAEAIEAEARRILEIKELRDYFRNPRGFFDEHIKRYSKSRRKAPIYWLLQSPKKSYALWIYYPRLDRDTVFKALRNYVEPKLKGEATRLRELKARLEEARESLPRHERSKLEKEIDRQEALLGELGAFKEALERVVALGYEPDLDDGVPLNIAPFHEVTPWKEANTYWEELLEGRYAWSTIGKRVRDRDVRSTARGRTASHGQSD